MLIFKCDLCKKEWDFTKEVGGDYSDGREQEKRIANALARETFGNRKEAPKYCISCQSRLDDVKAKAAQEAEKAILKEAKG